MSEENIVPLLTRKFYPVDSMFIFDDGRIGKVVRCAYTGWGGEVNPQYELFVRLQEEVKQVYTVVKERSLDDPDAVRITGVKANFLKDMMK